MTTNYIMKENKKNSLLDHSDKNYVSKLDLNEFLGDEIHYSLWYFEFKQEAQLKIEALEKRLFEIKDEAIEIHKEINNLNDAISNRLTMTLK